MFEAYKIGIRLSLINGVSTGLIGLVSQFNTLHHKVKDSTGAVTELEKRFAGLKKMTLIGGAMAGVGAFGLGVFGKMLKPATEYAHQLNIMDMAGLKHAELAEAIGEAWKNTGTIVTTTATENLRSLLDLRNVLGTMEEAKMALPIVSRIQAVLASSSEGQISGSSKELAYSMAKALDIIGAAQNRESFERQAEMMAKVIIATQGRVTPEAYKSTFQYARQAKYRLSDEFKYEILPSLIQENAAGGGGGGGSRGVGPMLAAFYRWANQGYINKMALPELQSLGLVDPRTALKTTTSGTTVGAMKDSDLAASNPFLWVQNVLVPAIKRKYGANLSKDQLLTHINDITRGNQLAANLLGEFAFKPINFLRDQSNIRGTMSTAESYKAALSNDPNTAFRVLVAQWENFKISFTMGVVPVLVPALIKLSSAFKAMGDWSRAHPTLAKDLSLLFAGVAGVAALGGTITLAAAGLKALGLALSFPAIGGAAGIAGLALRLGAVGVALYAVWTAADYFKDWLDKTRPQREKAKHDQKAHEARVSTGAQNRRDMDDAAKYQTDRFIAAQRGQSMQVHTQINMDGRKVADAVTQHQLKDASRGTLASGSSVDPNRTPVPAGLNYAR